MFDCYLLLVVRKLAKARADNFLLSGWVMLSIVSIQADSRLDNKLDIYKYMEYNHLPTCNTIEQLQYTIQITILIYIYIFQKEA